MLQRVQWGQRVAEVYTGLPGMESNLIVGFIIKSGKFPLFPV